jgi:hypothetical protein
MSYIFFLSLFVVTKSNQKRLDKKNLLRLRLRADSFLSQWRFLFTLRGVVSGFGIILFPLIWVVGFFCHPLSSVFIGSGMGKISNHPLIALTRRILRSRIFVMDAFFIFF